jgi:hypothetical protein
MWMDIGIPLGIAIVGMTVTGRARRTQVQTGMLRGMRAACIIKAIGMAITGGQIMTTDGIVTVNTVITAKMTVINRLA